MLKKNIIVGMLILFCLCITYSSYSQTRSCILETRTIETIAALKALRPITSGTIAIVRNYAASGDNGGGTFYYDSSSTAADNGGTIIAPTGYTTGRWLRDMSTNNDFKIEWFGGSPSAPDNSVPLSKAIIAANGKLIRFGFGEYSFTNSVAIATTTSFNISGQDGGYPLESAAIGSKSATIWRNACASNTAIINSTVGTHYSSRIANLAIVGGGISAGRLGLNFQKDFRQITIENVSFRDITNCLLIGNGEPISTVSALYSRIKNVSFKNVQKGIYCNAYCSGLILDGLKADTFVGTLLTFTEGFSFSLINSVIESGDGLAIDLSGIQSAVISNTYFEGSLMTLLKARTCRNITFEKNIVRSVKGPWADVYLKQPDTNLSVIYNKFRFSDFADYLDVQGNTSRATSGVLTMFGNAYELSAEMISASGWYPIKEPAGYYCRRKTFINNTLYKFGNATEPYYSPRASYPTEAEGRKFAVGFVAINDIPIDDYSYGGAIPYYQRLGPNYLGEALSLVSTGASATLFLLQVDDAGNVTATSTFPTP